MTSLIEHFERALGPVHTGWSLDPDGAEMPFQIVRFSGGSDADSVGYATLGLSRYPLLSPTSGRTIRYYVLAGDNPVLVHNASCRTFGHLSPGGRLDIPNVSGVYRIGLNDGMVYVGKASDIHNRFHAAFRKGGALFDRQLGQSDQFSWWIMSLAGR